MTEKDESNFIERFTVRMPDGMREAIAERAKRNSRSMNSEIIKILGEALHLDSKPDAWLERLMSYIEKKDPSNEDDRELFAHAISEALREVTMRIGKENDRLVAIANAQFKFQKKKI
ncbi:Arc family DNA-binding protein [Enterobacter hormaechei]|uniref:Arc family DNA-binding protein n=1 Tax=Enterobacter hormaechei TaxID=158836 RepID=UPI001BD46BD6|nr:Arc family DNA-binding protein [Enterobacter hormaechei]EMB6145872.1 Arc family DNA-binding protein [Enterobacter asburiae]MCE1967831.1 Arc family DNA-binding protein [Enterobacter hormaechei]MDP0434414.1 Arc family DNA-binding protein [Enterobacter hormaechei]DAF76677.1 MAG TPA: Arc-like DNA binding domain protein [Caudoviricetes sp.]